MPAQRWPHPPPPPQHPQQPRTTRPSARNKPVATRIAARSACTGALALHMLSSATTALSSPSTASSPSAGSRVVRTAEGRPLLLSALARRRARRTWRKRVPLCSPRPLIDAMSRSCQGRVRCLHAVLGSGKMPGFNLESCGKLDVVGRCGPGVRVRWMASIDSCFCSCWIGNLRPVGLTAQFIPNWCCKSGSVQFIRDIYHIYAGSRVTSRSKPSFAKCQKVCFVKGADMSVLIGVKCIFWGKRPI